MCVINLTCTCLLVVLSYHCLGVRLDEKLSPTPLTDAAMKGNPVFDIPIVVIPGE